MQIKNFFSVLILLFIALKINAQTVDYIYIESEDKKPFSVLLDNLNTYQSNDGYLIISKVPIGEHTILIENPSISQAFKIDLSHQNVYSYKFSIVNQEMDLIKINPSVEIKNKEESKKNVYIYTKERVMNQLNEKPKKTFLGKILGEPVDGKEIKKYGLYKQGIKDASTFGVPENFKLANTKHVKNISNTIEENIINNKSETINSNNINEEAKQKAKLEAIKKAEELAEKEKYASEVKRLEIEKMKEEKARLDAIAKEEATKAAQLAFLEKQKLKKDNAAKAEKEKQLEKARIEAEKENAKALKISKEKEKALAAETAKKLAAEKEEKEKQAKLALNNKAMQEAANAKKELEERNMLKEKARLTSEAAAAKARLEKNAEKNQKTIQLTKEEIENEKKKLKLAAAEKVAKEKAEKEAKLIAEKEATKAEAKAKAEKLLADVKLKKEALEAAKKAELLAKEAAKKEAIEKAQAAAEAKEIANKKALVEKLAAANAKKEQEELEKKLAIEKAKVMAEEKRKALELEALNKAEQVALDNANKQKEKEIALANTKEKLDNKSTTEKTKPIENDDDLIAKQETEAKLKKEIEALEAKRNALKNDINNVASSNTPLTKLDKKIQKVQNRPNPNCMALHSEENLVTYFQKLEAKTDDEARVNYCRKMIKDKKCFMCKDVEQLAQSFNTQTGKFDFVKLILPYISDNENYETLENIFRFESYKEKIRLEFGVRDN